MSTGHLVVTTTTDSEAAAHAIANAVVDARFGACAQIVGPITSVFRWEGEVRSEVEWRVEIKTTAGRLAELTEYIIELHEYDVPEVVATPIVGGSDSYLSWVRSEIRSSR